MSTALTYLIGHQHGRLQRQGDPSDVGSAVMLTAVSEPFALADLDTFEIAVDGGTVQKVQFDTADFTDIAAATAAEVVAVLNAALTGVTADDQGGHVRLTSDTTGSASRLHIVDGTARGVLLFPGVPVTGFTGEWSFVLGHDRPGVEDVFQDGDGLTIGQAADIGDDLRVRLIGEVRWPTQDPAPPGYAWEVVLTVDGDEYVLQDPNKRHTLSRHVARTSLNDALQNTSGLSGTVPIHIGLRLADAGGGAGNDVTYEVPAVYVDAVEVAETLAPLTLGQRLPVPDTTGWPDDYPLLELTIINTTADPVDLAATIVEVDVNGTPYVAYDGGSGGFQTGFSGTTTPGVGPDWRDTAIAIDWTNASFYPFASEDVVTVQVTTDVDGGGSQTVLTYAFVMADTEQPRLVSAQARHDKVVRLTFSEPMDGPSVGSATYGFMRQSSPAVSLQAVSAQQVSATEVDVTVDIEMSMGAEYLVTVTGAEDLQGNVIDPDHNEAAFIGYYCARPPGRDFEFWKFMPAANRREDTTGDLRRWALIQQDIIDLLLCSIDRWTEIFDVDVASEQFVDAILAHLGNPFKFPDLSLADKRRLGRILVDIYRQKGTEPGIINAILFFTGIPVTLDIINTRDFWQIGVDLLGATTYLAPADGDPLWYSFFIESPVELTPEQRSRILGIADYMKPAHEHIIDISEPGDVVGPTSFWILGVSELGTETVLSA